MGKTLRKHKGKKYAQAKERKSKLGEKKFFGETDGQHSNINYDYIEKEGRIVKQKKCADKIPNKTPVKGKDFIKSGWPFETRHKNVIKNKEKEEDVAEQIEEGLKDHDEK